jgi:hypothetical protein
MRLLPHLLVFASALFHFTSAHAELTEEQQRLSIEADAPDPALTKILLLAGSTSNKPGQHEYVAGCALLQNWLKNIPGVWPVLITDGWPKNEALFKDAKAIVVYADGGTKLPFLAPERWNIIKELVSKGAGLVMLHQAVDIPEDRAAELQQWLGGAWQKDIGCRGHWDMEFSQFPNHPTLQGMSPFAAPMDGWLYNLHLSPNIIPLLTGMVPEKSRSTPDAKAHADRPEVIAWAYHRADGGRSFAFTGCDLHRNWTVEGQRRFVMNGVLWSAGLKVPSDGAPVPLEAGAMAANLDAKPPASPAPQPTPTQQ